MSAKAIEGREIANKILAEVRSEISQENLKIKLGIIQVGNDEATNIYIKNKIKRASEVGINAEVIKLDADATEKELEQLIKDLNTDPATTGFFVQVPLPPQLNPLKLISQIDPVKDVDGMTPTNLGKLFHNDSTAIAAATAGAVLKSLQSITDFKLEGKHTVIVSRSVILGKPLAALLLQQNCTVTVAHSKTVNLAQLCKSADIIVSATGQEKLITKDFAKTGAVLIDCGSPKPELDMEHLMDTAAYYTPVPGGIGPLTIACLLQNCVKAARK